MLAPLLATKLYVPSPRPHVVSRPRLIDRLNEGLKTGCKLTLVSAPAGFGKTTLVSEWIATFTGSGVRVAWFSLDENDSDLARFLLYFISAVQTVAPKCGENVLSMLHASQMQPTEVMLTTLLNELAAIPDRFILVLDDYHTLDCKPIDEALTFLIDHQPPHMQLVITTREDPALPLARLRVRGQLTELRTADLRFTPDETAEFLNRVMGLNLSAEDISALENRTEGWIAGLQLAAISVQGRSDVAGFIESFTGSHHFILDYLLEEVLQRQTPGVQSFLLHTSMLERLCGPLCEAVVLEPATSGQATLEYLERTNLFITPLDNERRWYRYHHLFRDLLRQRLGQSLTPEGVTDLHIRASQWFEDHHLEIEAFQHAAAANDVERAERLIDGKGLHLPFHGVAAMLGWLESLPPTVLDARPALWVRSALSSLFTGQTIGVEEKLQAAEDALHGVEANDQTRNLIGQIAGARAILALTQYQIETMLAQSRRALEYLHPRNLSSRATANWTLGFAYMLQGDRAAARQSYLESIRLGQACGNIFTTSLATNDLGNVQEIENQLHQAAETYQQALQLFGDRPPPHAGQAYLGLARIAYEWNDLEAADQYGQQSLQLARQYDRMIDRFIGIEVFLARLKLAQGDAAGAAAILDQADRTTRERNFVQRRPEIAAAQVLTLLHQGEAKAAAQLAQAYDLSVSRARVHLAEGNSAAAIAILESHRQQMEAKGWADERLKTMVLQSVVLHAHGDKDLAVQVLSETLALAEPGGFIRLFVDEGEAMRLLMVDCRVMIEKQKHVGSHLSIEYVNKLLAAFPQSTAAQSAISIPQHLHRAADAVQVSTILDSLSPRELEVLRLIEQGLSNQEIADRLFLALNTVKGYTRTLFDKLQVQRRTEAVARARELRLL